jgi:hypothetical protein
MTKNLPTVGRGAVNTYLTRGVRGSLGVFVVVYYCGGSQNLEEEEGEEKRNKKGTVSLVTRKEGSPENRFYLVVIANIL